MGRLLRDVVPVTTIADPLGLIGFSERVTGASELTAHFNLNVGPATTLFVVTGSSDKSAKIWDVSPEAIARIPRLKKTT